MLILRQRRDGSAAAVRTTLHLRHRRLRRAHFYNRRGTPSGRSMPADSSSATARRLAPGKRPPGCSWPAATSALGRSALALAGVLSLLSSSVAVALAVAYPNLPDISELSDYRPKLPLRVFSAEGVLIGEFGEERRNLTPIAADPEGHEGRGAGHRGRALLRARRRRLQGHAARGAGQPGPGQEPGRLDHHHAGGAQRLPVAPRRPSPARSTRCC